MRRLARSGSTIDTPVHVTRRRGLLLKRVTVLTFHHSCSRLIGPSLRGLVSDVFLTPVPGAWGPLMADLSRPSRSQRSECRRDALLTSPPGPIQITARADHQAHNLPACGDRDEVSLLAGRCPAEAVARDTAPTSLPRESPSAVQGCDLDGVEPSSLTRAVTVTEPRQQDLVRGGVDRGRCPAPRSRGTLTSTRGCGERLALRRQGLQPSRPTRSGDTASPSTSSTPQAPTAGRVTAAPSAKVTTNAALSSHTPTAGPHSPAPSTGSCVQALVWSFVSAGSTVSSGQRTPWRSIRGWTTRRRPTAPS